MARLVKLSGDVPWDTFDVEDAVLIGRSADCQVVIDDKSVSRQHARILRTKEGFVIEDLASTNGTYVNGTRVSRRLLQEGDEIRIRKSIFRFQSEKRAAEESNVAVIMDTPESSSQQILQKVDARPPTDSQILASVPDARAQDTRRLVLRLRTFQEVAETIGVVQELDSLLERIMDSLFRFFAQAERGFIMLQSEDGAGGFVPRVVKRRHPGDAKEIAVSQSIISEVVDGKVGVLSADAQADERFEGRKSIAGANIRSMMCVPLVCQDQLLGLIYIDTSSATASFDQEDLHLLAGIASQAAISIRNAQLVKEVKQEAENRSSLARYLSPALVEQVMGGNLDLKLGGHLSKGTVFFCDIIGFTQMALTMRPEEVVRRLNQYFEVMIDLVFAHRGMVDKLGGDAIMAVWGVPVQRKEDALSAILAALEMQNALFGFNLALERDGIRSIQMGIGINTGVFLAGNIGATRRMEYTIIGDNVNLAKRIEGKATRGQVYISDSTYEETMGKLLAVRMPPTTLRGARGTVELLSIRGAIQHEGEEGEELLLSIPTTFTTDDGQSKEPGQLVAASVNSPRGVELILLTPGELALNTEVTLSPVLPEKPTLPQFRATVTGTSSVMQGSTSYVHGKVLLKPTELPSILRRLLRSRQVLTADLSVDDILRE